ncbi:MAG TPA: hydantoinase/oxoprolinase family protein [Chloroflexota bacterium]|nr:hydantoinase/oxoprolinase family protein [Chloroflexota bacterium]
MNRHLGSLRIGVDVGGTFTDLVVVDASGRVATRKLSTTPDDYLRAICEGILALLDELSAAPSAVHEIVHGTTVATNAILERRGPRTGLLTTRGFRDTLEIGRLRYPRLYDLTWQKPAPLVERRWRREVRERLDAQGRIVEPLDEESVHTAIAFLVAEGVQALAVTLVHSYVNATHERRVAEISRELAPGLILSLSSDVLPEIGEYERTSTTVLNAYLQPVVSRYLGSFESVLHQHDILAPVLVMQSSGGIIGATAAAQRPIHIVESGPAAGVIAAQQLASRLDLVDLITLDMGGTTAKSSIVEHGRLQHVGEYEVGAGLNVGNRLNRGAGYILRVPAINVAEVGAGGGSVVWVDPAGALHVGPRSAGASPGPACYPAGGDEPTLTDANVILGYVNPTALLGGALPIDRKRAWHALAAGVAEPLGMDVVEAAFGVHRLAVANMVRVVKAVSSERGRDPRRFTLIAYGGNGPVHAALVARELGIRRVIVPRWPGLFSALGLLWASPAHHLSRAILLVTRDLEPQELENAFQALAATIQAEIRHEGNDPATYRFERTLDLRYAGQSFELRLPFGDAPATTSTIRALDERFGVEHERTYGHRAATDPVEIVNARVSAVADRPATDGNWSDFPRMRRASSASARPAYFGSTMVEVPVLDRFQITAEPRSGPLIVEEYDATTVVPPNTVIRRDHWDNLVLEPVSETPMMPAFDAPREIEEVTDRERPA